MGYKHLATAESPWGLTAQEATVMRLLVRFGLVDPIVKEMRVREQTVRGHLNRAMMKMGARNRVLAALMFDRRMREEHKETARRANSVFALGAQD